MESNNKKAAKFIYTMIAIGILESILHAVVKKDLPKELDGMFSKGMQYTPELLLVIFTVIKIYGTYSISTGNKIFRRIYTLFAILDLILFPLLASHFGTSTPDEIAKNPELEWSYIYGILGIITCILHIYALKNLYPDFVSKMKTNKGVVKSIGVSIALLLFAAHGGMIYWSKIWVEKTIRELNTGKISVKLKNYEQSFATSMMDIDVAYSNNSPISFKLTMNHFSYFFPLKWPSLSFVGTITVKNKKFPVEGRIGKSGLVEMKSKMDNVVFTENDFQISSKKMELSFQDYIIEPHFSVEADDISIEKGKIKITVGHFKFGSGLQMQSQIPFQNGEFVAENLHHDGENFKIRFNIGQLKKFENGQILPDEANIFKISNFSITLNNSKPIVSSFELQSIDLNNWDMRFTGHTNIPISLVEELVKYFFKHQELLDKFQLPGHLFKQNENYSLEENVHSIALKIMKKGINEYQFNGDTQLLVARLAKKESYLVNENPVAYCPSLKGEESALNKPLLLGWTEDKLIDYALEKLFLFPIEQNSKVDANCALSLWEQKGFKKDRELVVKLKKLIHEELTVNSDEELKFLHIPSCLPRFHHEEGCVAHKAEVEQLVKSHPQNKIANIMLFHLRTEEHHWDQAKTVNDSFSNLHFDINNPLERLSSKFYVINKMAMFHHEKREQEYIHLLETSEAAFATEYYPLIYGETLISRNDFSFNKNIERLLEKSYLIRQSSHAEKLLKKQIIEPATKLFESKAYTQCMNSLEHRRKDRNDIIGSELRRVYLECLKGAGEIDRYANWIGSWCGQYEDEFCHQYFESIKKMQDADNRIEHISYKCFQNKLPNICLTLSLYYAEKKEVEKGFKALKIFLDYGEMNKVKSQEDMTLLKSVSVWKGEKLQFR